MSLLPPKVPCDCGTMTVCRSDGVPTCHRCQQARRAFAQTWVGQEPPAFKMDELVKLAVQRPVHHIGISYHEIAEAWHHDVALKHAMTSMRFEEYRRQHPHVTKDALANGPG